MTGRPGRADRGSVTVEIAVALPALVVVLWAAVTTIMAVTAQLRCLDAAREGARAAARGEPRAAVQEVAQRAAPADARVTLTSAGDRVSVEVTTRVTLLGGDKLSLTVQGRAVAMAEPGIAEAGR